MSPSICVQPDDCHYKCAEVYAIVQQWDSSVRTCSWTATPAQPPGCHCDVLTGTPGRLDDGEGNGADTRWAAYPWSSSLVVVAEVQGLQCTSIYTQTSGGAWPALAPARTLKLGMLPFFS